MSIASNRFSLYQDRFARRYSGLWARVDVEVALAIARVDGVWSTHAVITPELRATADRIVGGGYQHAVTADELAEMVVDEVITAAEYTEITGLAYGGVDPEAPAEPEPDVPAEEFPDPDDPGGSGSTDDDETFPDELPMTLA